MSVNVDASRVHHDTHRPSAAPRLLVELRRRAAESPDGIVRATTRDLAHELDVTWRTIQRARLDWIATGVIEVVGDLDDRHAVNAYRVLL